MHRKPKIKNKNENKVMKSLNMHFLVILQPVCLIILLNYFDFLKLYLMQQRKL